MTGTDLLLLRRTAKNRTGASMTQDELARALGVARKTVTRWERGHCDITLPARQIREAVAAWRRNGR